ncbi:MAG: hypothetical protein M3O23_11685 [Actinomycetota bacterium]|nr:hypothetical protein [Actinomycetota bacterium]
MSATRLVRGFRLSWRELTGRRRRRRPTAAAEPLSELRCWTVVRVPDRRRARQVEVARRR